MEIEKEDRPKKPQVPIPMCWEVVHYKRLGYTGSQVSQILPISVSECSRIYLKWKQTGDVEDLDRSGKPLITTPDQEKTLIETAKANPDRTINQNLEESKLEVSEMTGWRRLEAYGFKYKSSSIKWYISPDDRKKRLMRAKNSIKLPNEFWKRLVFTDESKVQFNTKKQKLWVCKDETPTAIERDKWHVSILIWGAISYDGKSILEIVEGTMNSETYLKILKRRLLRNFPTLRNSSPFDADSGSLYINMMIPRPMQLIKLKTILEKRIFTLCPGRLGLLI